LPLMFKFLVILLMSAAPAGAQVYLGAGLSPDSLTKAKEVKLSQGSEDAFAEAFVLENSTASLYAVFESTAPARAAASCMRNGIYRQELLILYAIARDSKTTFTALSGQREKGVSLREIARENKADLIKIFVETEDLQKRIDVRTAFMNVSALTDAGLSTPTVSTNSYENK